MQHSRQSHVIGIAPAAGQEAVVLETGDRLADAEHIAQAIRPQPARGRLR